VKPQVVGELKIPGYSDYLHPLGADHLIGFGRGAIDGLYQEMQLSLFDVSDMADPQRTDLYLFDGGRSGSSEALYEHLAFSFFAEQGILVVPTTMGYYDSEGGAAVFSVTVEDGFEYLGSVAHDSPVRRTLRIGEYLYSISRDAVKVTELTQPGALVASVDL
jgi:uncharacterized secreted protein with C-terminal beta-propeller domain